MVNDTEFNLSEKVKETKFPKGSADWIYSEDVKEFIKRRINDIDEELIEIDEEVGDEVKSVLKVLKFKLIKDAGNKLIE